MFLDWGSMENKKSGFVRCAKGLIDLVLDATGQDLVYKEFCGREPRLARLSFAAFSAEYVPAKLALGCVFWVACCADHRLEDKELKNLYFKEVMGLFESPKSLQNATKFSECLYASNADPEQSPVLGVIAHLFHKLGLDAIVKTGREDAGELNAGFSFMMEVSEALKIVFENRFNEFYYSHETPRVAGAARKA